MEKCVYCGQEVDVSHARRVCGRYWAGAYDECFPDGDVCASCASCEISSNMKAGADLQELMHWDDD